MTKIAVYCSMLIIASASLAMPAFADRSHTEKFGSGDCPLCTNTKSNSHTIREEPLVKDNIFEEKAPKTSLNNNATENSNDQWAKRELKRRNLDDRD